MASTPGCGGARGREEGGGRELAALAGALSQDRGPRPPQAKKNSAPHASFSPLSHTGTPQLAEMWLSRIIDTQKKLESFTDKLEVLSTEKCKITTEIAASVN